MEKDMNFEQALTELEQIVEQLNRDELSLADSVKAFQKGMELSKMCEKMLNEAHLDVIKAVGEDGSETTLSVDELKED